MPVVKNAPARDAERRGPVERTSGDESGCHLNDCEQRRHDDEGESSASADKGHGYLLPGNVWDEPLDRSAAYGILPPAVSTTFFTIANPMPALSAFCSELSVLNGKKAAS